jgi:hypothetical protein
MKSLRLLLWLLLLLLPFQALAENRVIPVKFAPGTSGATLVEGIARGENATFTLGAGAGQRMRVGMTSSEDNAVFDVYAPDGSALGSSSEKNGEQVWYGSLPQSGTYKVEVGLTRGSSEVTISFLIK